MVLNKEMCKYDTNLVAVFKDLGVVFDNKFKFTI